jgi:hypothetical protein
MKRRRPGRERTISGINVYLIGVLANLTATAFTLAITWAEDFSGFQILTTTALIFLAGSIVVLMTETRKRSDRGNTLVEIIDSLARNSKAYIQFRQLGESLMILLDHYPDQPELDIARQIAMQQCHESLAELSQGHLDVRSGDTTYKRALLDRGLQLRTTSLLRTNLSFWKSDQGIQYWREQSRALKTRSQTIERIFICESLTEEIKELIGEHVQAGVITYLAFESDLPETDRVDITLWGSEALYYQRCLQKPPNTGYWYDRFSVQPREVADAERQYKRIFEVAELVDKSWPKETV